MACRPFDSFPNLVDCMSIPKQDMSKFPPPVLLYRGVESFQAHKLKNGILCFLVQ